MSETSTESGGGGFEPMAPEGWDTPTPEAGPGYDPVAPAGWDADVQPVVDELSPDGESGPEEAGQPGLDAPEGVEAPQGWDGKGDHPGKAINGIPEKAPSSKWTRSHNPDGGGSGVLGGGGGPKKRLPKIFGGRRSGGSGGGGGFSLLGINLHIAAPLSNVRVGGGTRQVHGIHVQSGRPSAGKRR
jgi:hypothetical protein